ncbi:MAG: DUF364 domain-containing protein [PVC group bacterium]
MKLLKEILTTLPEGHSTQEIYIGAFDTVVKSLRWGISSTFRDPVGENKSAWIKGAGELIGRPALDLARYVLSDNLLEASLGMAAINSLLHTEGIAFHEINAARIVREHGKGKNVAVVGDFPFLEKIRSEVNNLWVISRRPWEGEEGVKEARSILPRADVVALTGSSFINHTAEVLLSLCPRAYTLILGPSTPLSPVLFRYGADAICGTLIDDPDRALPFIRQGASFRHIQGLRLVTMFKDGVPDDNDMRSG